MRPALVQSTANRPGPQRPAGLRPGAARRPVGARGPGAARTHALAVRSERESFFSLGAWSNPFLLGAVIGAVAAQLAILYLPVLQAPFETQALGPLELALVLVASSTAFVAVELEKWIIRRRSRRSRQIPA